MHIYFTTNILIGVALASLLGGCLRGRQLAPEYYNTRVYSDPRAGENWSSYVAGAEQRDAERERRDIQRRLSDIEQRERYRRLY